MRQVQFHICKICTHQTGKIKKKMSVIPEMARIWQKRNSYKYNVGQSINLYNHLALLGKLRLCVFLTHYPSFLDDPSEDLLNKGPGPGCSRSAV